MKKTISFFTKGKALWSGLLLVGALMFIGASTASAQSTAAGSVNPYSHIAEKLGVTAYPLGTFEYTHTMDVIEGILQGMKQGISGGNATEYQKLKYDYLNSMMHDIHDGSIAVEITLLTSLSGLDDKQNTLGTQQSQLASLYNEVVAQLQ